MSAVSRRRATFRALHESGCFVIPNPWDVGTVRALEALGFPALATTSAGMGYTRGLPDGRLDSARQYIRRPRPPHAPHGR